MAFNFRSSGSKHVFLDDSQLSNHRYYRFPDETGTFVTSVSTGSFPFTASRAVTSSYAISASMIIGGAGATISNAGDNRIITSDGTSTGLVAESNIQFSGNILSITGSVTASQFTGSNLSGLPAFIGLVTSASFVQVYDSTSANQTWTKPSWAQKITVFIIGGGGGGGGGNADLFGTTAKSGGGGGAGGEMVWNTYLASDLPNSAISLQIGAGGGGGAAGSDGQAGGNSVFGSDTETSYVVLTARGGYPGAKGVNGTTTSLTSVDGMTRPAPGKPSSFNSTGAGGGGYGTPTDTKWGQMYIFDAPNVPYTVNDIYLSSYRFYGLSNFQNLNLMGVPAAICPTGGGGGVGALGTTHQNVTRAGLGGSIKKENANIGGRTTQGGTVNDFKSQGVVNKDYETSITSNVYTNASVEKFMRYVKIGLGGAGGYGNGLNVYPPTTGSKYGGGGGGGRFNQAGAAGGSGAIIIFSEA